MVLPDKGPKPHGNTPGSLNDTVVEAHVCGRIQRLQDYNTSVEIAHRWVGPLLCEPQWCIRPAVILFLSCNTAMGCLEAAKCPCCLFVTRLCLFPDIAVEPMYVFVCVCNLHCCELHKCWVWLWTFAAAKPFKTLLCLITFHIFFVLSRKPFWSSCVNSTPLDSLIAVWIAACSVRFDPAVRNVISRSF